MSPQQIDGALAAAEHLQTNCLAIRFDPDVIRAAWKSGHHNAARDLWAIYADREKVA
jgi:hypothetical protein